MYVQHLGSVVMVYNHARCGQLLIKAWRLLLVEVLQRRGHILQDAHNYFGLQLNCLIVQYLLQGTHRGLHDHLQ